MRTAGDNLVHGRQSRTESAFVRRGLSNLTTRRKLLEVQKNFDPDVAVPEINESNPLRQEIGRLHDRLDERDEKERLDTMNSLVDRRQG